MIAAVVATLVGLLAAIAAWLGHQSRVRAAEARGRLEEMERARRVADAVREAQDVAIGRVLDGGDRSALAAELAASLDEEVTPRERDGWIGPPRDPGDSI